MDARIRYSQKAIKLAFCEMFKTKPLEKITVTDICKSADINRATFYKYYKNPQDLLEHLEDESLGALEKKLVKINATGIEDIYSIILEDVKEHFPFYRIVFCDNCDDAFRRKLLALCHDFEIKEIKRFFPYISEKQCEWLYRFIAEGCIGIFKQWVNGEIESTIEDMITFTVDFVSKINKHGIDFKEDEK